MRIEETLKQEISELAARSGCQLLEIEPRGSTLRLVLDRPEGVTLADCETVSKQVSALLDVTDFGSGKYLLEVTSPGLDRKLYGPEDFARFAGESVRVTWKTAEMETRRTVVGRLERFDPEGGGRITVVEDGGSEELQIPLSAIQQARLVPVF